MKKTVLNSVVIEIDEVELLITPSAELEIEENQEIIILHRLFDNRDLPFPLAQVKEALEKNIVDRL